MNKDGLYRLGDFSPTEKLINIKIVSDLAEQTRKARTDVIDVCLLLTRNTTDDPAETAIRNLHVVSREEMQPSDSNPRIRPNTPSLRYGRRTTPLFDDRSCPPSPASPATSPKGGGRRGEHGARLLRVHRYHSRWIPFNHLRPIPASLPWVL